MDFEKLNSATKYPSIFTHHELGERGMLKDTLGPFASVNSGERVYLREKVDGTNTRVIVLPDGDYFIGSREELLYSRGDRLANPALGIVEAVKPLADHIAQTDAAMGADIGDNVFVLYLETYGGKIGAQAKQYSGSGRVGYRMFDCASVPLDALNWDRAVIARWRDEDGGQQFMNTEDLRVVSRLYDIPLVPNLGSVRAGELPVTLEGMLDFLKRNLPDTLADLDDDAKGMPEGIVLRTGDRKVISKARFVDYQRTLKRLGKL